MKNMTFGQLLEKLLYLSNQKKSVLAKELGYDISYISKWVNGKNLPTQKNISNICKIASEFIVNSLNELSRQELKQYFEIDTEIKNDNELKSYLEYSLRESYMNSAENTIPNIYQKTNSEDNYNSIIHINPRLRKQYLSRYVESYIKKSETLDMIIFHNIYGLNDNDKVVISNMKNVLSSISDKKDIRVSLLLGFEGENDDIVFNTMSIINMITTHSNMNFKVYNCDIDQGLIISVIKGVMFHTATFTKDKRCLFTNMSRKKSVIDDAYNTLDELRLSKAKEIVYNIKKENYIKEKVCLQYIMGNDLRLLIGYINEFFMPEDLFDEISNQVFKDDKDIISDLKKVNMFLQNVTYNSEMKVLIYEKELIKYITTGEVNFFNNQINLNQSQVKRHVNYIKSILEDNNSKIQIKLIEGYFIEEFKDYKNSTIYLSKDLKIAKIYPEDNGYDYAIIKDNHFKNVCDEFFEYLWSNKNELLVHKKEEIVQKIDKTLLYTDVVNAYKNK